MSTAKKILLVVVSLLLARYSWELASDLHSYASPLPVGEQLFWGLVLAASVTGIFAFAGFAFRTHRLLPESYYRVERGGRLLRLYDWTKAGWMRRLLLLLFWGWTRNREAYFDGTREGLADFDRRTRGSEFGHMASFVVLLPLALDLSLTGQAVAGGMVLAANWIGNFYPALIQRHHRLRIQRIRKRLSRR